MKVSHLPTLEVPEVVMLQPPALQGALEALAANHLNSAKLEGQKNYLVKDGIPGYRNSYELVISANNNNNNRRGSRFFVGFYHQNKRKWLQPNPQSGVKFVAESL